MVLVLYDGVCGLCNRLNQFILKRDAQDQFRFASLQSKLATDLIRRHGRDASNLDTVYAVVDYGAPGELLLSSARAVLFVLTVLGGAWAWARFLQVLPTWLLDAGYRFVASRRYRWFGRFDTCMAPNPRYQSKFLDQ